MFGFEREVWFRYVDFEHAKPLLKPAVKPKDWSGEKQDDAAVLAEMRDYAAFGWEKIENHRGLSASRTVEKMQAWLWLLGTTQADELIRFAGVDENYPMYGAPILAAICAAYDFPIPDNEAVRRMRQGKPCVEGCREGCV
jgi:hypothetical protein